MLHKIVRYVDSVRGFEYMWEPTDDKVMVAPYDGGYLCGYLIRDDCSETPSEWGDNSLLLVHYHRDCYITCDKIIVEDDARRWYQGVRIGQAKKYFIFPVSALIHGGTGLRLGSTSFIEDCGRWDTSHVGLVLADRKEFKTEDAAHKAAEGLIETWNQYLSGDIWTRVIEKFDADKRPVDYETVGGHYGYDYAKAKLELEFRVLTKGRTCETN